MTWHGEVSSGATSGPPTTSEVSVFVAQITSPLTALQDGSSCIEIWQCWSAEEFPQIMQRGKPRNVSRASMLVLNAVVPDDADGS